MAGPLNDEPGIASEHADDELALLLLLLHRGYANSPSQDQDEVVQTMSQQLVMKDPADVIKAGLLQSEVVDRAWKMQKEVPKDRLALKTCATSTEPWNLSPSEMRERRLPLPFKLYSILTNPHYRRIVSWLPGGRTWKIHDLEAFTDKVLPQYFDYGSYNFNIFVRLLKLWNFSTYVDGGARSYFHEDFVEGKPELVRDMRPGDFPKENSDQNSSPTCRCVRLEDFLKAQQTGSLHPRRKHGSQSATPPGIIQSWDINLQVLRRLVVPSRKSTESQNQLLGFNHQFPKGLSLKQSLKTKSLFEPVGSLNEFKFHVSMKASSKKGKRNKVQKHLKIPSGTRTTTSEASTPAATEDSSTGTKRSLIKSATGLATTAQHPSPPTKAKKKRRKWLPPLGPPTIQFTPKNRGKSRMDWIFTSPEAFATMHGP